MGLAACNKTEQPQEHATTQPVQAAAPTTKPAETAAVGVNATESQEARTIFTSRCSTCHGAEGKGNGAAAVALNPKPRNYTDPAWQKSVTDDHLREIIVKGGGAVGKSPLMPPNPDLENKPEVVNGLVAIVRSFGASAK